MGENLLPSQPPHKKSSPSCFASLHFWHPNPDQPGLSASPCHGSLIVSPPGVDLSLRLRLSLRAKGCQRKHPQEPYAPYASPSWSHHFNILTGIGTKWTKCIRHMAYTEWWKNLRLYVEHQLRNKKACNSVELDTSWHPDSVSKGQHR